MKKDKVITSARVIICKQLAEIARANNITHQQVADNIGIKRESVTRIFSGRFSVGIDLLLAIAREVDANILLEDKNGLDALADKGVRMSGGKEKTLLVPSNVGLTGEKLAYGLLSFSVGVSIGYYLLG